MKIFKRHLNKRAASVLEYTMVIVVIIAAILVMQRFIGQAMMGRWKSVGDSFGFGRQYQPGDTGITENDGPINAPDAPGGPDEPDDPGGPGPGGPPMP